MREIGMIVPALILGFVFGAEFVEYLLRRER